MQLAIACDWRGQPLVPAARAQIELARDADAWRVAFDAPYFADPPPPSPIGSTPRLWEHEVIELFVAGASEHYLELEFGPHGHYLALELSGVRRVVREGMPLQYAVQISALEDPTSAKPAGACGAPVGRYRGTAIVPVSYLPRSPERVNAYLIHGGSADRCHHAHAAVPGERPDFHQLEHFVPLSW